tara:strand:+ start:121 stop:276 length:156 start_codon:yes stop_codon:yes gene_type:complete
VLGLITNQAYKLIKIIRRKRKDDEQKGTSNHDKPVNDDIHYHDTGGSSTNA